MFSAKRRCDESTQHNTTQHSTAQHQHNNNNNNTAQTTQDAIAHCGGITNRKRIGRDEENMSLIYFFYVFFSKFPAKKAGHFTIELCARHNCPLNKGVL
jgi:hypothetical protein